jgi:hypothetical protein
MASATLLDLRMEKETFLKNVPEVLSDLFSTAYFDFFSTGLQLKAMDTSGGAYVVLQLRSEAFDHYSRDRFSMGLDLVAMAKAFSSADNNNDIITIKSLGGMIFEISLESPGKFAGHARTSFALADLLTDPVLILGLWTGSRVFRRFSLDFVCTDGVYVSVPQHPDSAYEAIPP